MKIKNINNNDRPRERLINNGASSLTDYELLAIILSSGTKNESVIDLSIRLINEYGFDRLFKMNYDELKMISGIKEAKATKLMAVFEIARRANINKNDISLLDSKDLYNYSKDFYIGFDYEMLLVIFVNKLCKIINYKKFTNKGVIDVEVPFKDIILNAINNNAYGIFIVHNHPSGDITPSISDINVTKELINLLKPLNIILLDSLIISNDKYYSICDNLDKNINIINKFKP